MQRAVVEVLLCLVSPAGLQQLICLSYVCGFHCALVSSLVLTACDLLNAAVEDGWHICSTFLTWIVTVVAKQNMTTLLMK